MTVNTENRLAAGPDLRDLLKTVIRRRSPALSCMGAGILITLLLAMLLPARYQSSATILIEQQELPVDLVRSTVTSYADQRVQIISQRVMTTETLLKVINSSACTPPSALVKPAKNSSSACAPTSTSA